MPDIDDLDNFSEGLHVSSLPASEVRRRGDRMRRRNTALATVGGVVAAAVFIGTPVALLSGGDDGRDVQPAPPAPSVTEDGRPGWLTEIPAEFPLADGFPETNGSDGSPTEIVRGPDITPLDLCGTSWPAVAPVDASGIAYLGESEDTSARLLVLLEDDTAATASLDALVSAVQACPNQATEGGDSILESQLVDLDLGTEQSVVVAQQVREDDGLLSQLTVTEASRSGNALFVETSYGSAGGPEVVDFETARLRERSTTVLASMCVFSADPCSTTAVTPDPESSPEGPVEEGLAGIPEGFPLAAGLTPDSEGQFEGPSASTEGILPQELCDRTVFPLEGVERLAVIAGGIEYSYRRELTTFATTDEAVAAVADVRSAVAACPANTGATAFETQIFTVLEGDTGYEDSVIFGMTYGEGLGGTVHEVIRVGHAVLVTYATAEMSIASLQPAADIMTEDNRAITAAMCLWTADGC